MDDIAIRVEGLSKRYRIQQGARARYGTLRDALVEAVRAPFRRRSSPGSAGNDSCIWALKDVSFEVKRGEVVGIIGRNGAGKTTLLKILSRITEPTEGWAEVRGRVGSLLEVGTGFHPELTGRENIYLNGAILGMRKAEIDRKFDEIVAFAEIEKFIDTPVKFYSSGMYVRLAFAVAAHLDPEILLVDEVLAVGDAAFQKKCLGKMGEVAAGGRTVFFVSHNMAAISSLCKRAFLLDKGVVQMDGQSERVISTYLGGMESEAPEIVWPDLRSAPGDESVRIKAVRAYSAATRLSPFPIDKPVILELDYANLLDGNRVFVAFRVRSVSGEYVFETFNSPEASENPDPFFWKPLAKGIYRSRCIIPGNTLNDIRYSVTALVASTPPPRALAEVKEAISFSVLDTGSMRTPGLSGRWLGCVRMKFHWQTLALSENLYTQERTAR